MTIMQAIKKAVDEDNAEMCGKIADTLRFKHGMDYEQIFSLVQGMVPEMTAARWDDLMRRADEGY